MLGSCNLLSVIFLSTLFFDLVGSGERAIKFKKKERALIVNTLVKNSNYNNDSSINSSPTSSQELPDLHNPLSLEEGLAGLAQQEDTSMRPTCCARCIVASSIMTVVCLGLFIQAHMIVLYYYLFFY